MELRSCREKKKKSTSVERIWLEVRSLLMHDMSLIIGTKETIHTKETHLEPLLGAVPFKHWEISHPQNRMCRLSIRDIEAKSIKNIKGTRKKGEVVDRWTE